MKITVLLRYPKLESSRWKIELIEKLISDGFEISLLFGDKSVFKQAKAVISEFGFDVFKKKKKLEQSGNKNLYKYFKKRLNIYKVQNLNSTKSENIIKSISPEFLLLLGTEIIRKNILVLPSRGSVHCHHGFLPKYRGVSTAEWNLFYEDDVYITTHFVDPGIDTGDILLRKKIPLEKSDTIQTLRSKCRTVSADLIVETFNKLRNNEIQRTPQSKQDGKQFYSMHPFFKELVERKISYIGD